MVICLTVGCKCEFPREENLKQQWLIKKNVEISRRCKKPERIILVASA